ncbi:dehydrodolichyl diphosphate synthase complex subunit DHDDS-like [Lineus longissimus]|uniref:dehydrodolichyl diphosphate synthase complex subunit DHDDS-like n=1 Tax=Lineus longissimus TaxID=88925 RepID=UPI002B4C794C
MSWIRENEGSQSSWLRRFCANVLKAGPLPKHVAFIMDGNRRFASKKSIQRAEGHLMGFEKLSETLEWCRDLDITEVTVYAFSIENFKRSKEEVDGLMELAREKFVKLLEEKERLKKYDICVRVIGNLSLLPHDIQESIAEAVYYTKDHKRATLNVCMPYTSRDEICAAMREVTEGVQLGLLRESDISAEVVDKCLYTNHSPHPDLVVRTSGEVRLSDFLLLQSSFSVLAFVKVLWPEFSIWHLYAAILHYQQNYKDVQKAKDYRQAQEESDVEESDYNHVKDHFHKDHRAKDSPNIQQRLLEYKTEREQRIRTFLTHLENKRTKYFEDLCLKRNQSGAKEDLVHRTSNHAV